jgi:hypothetical protein
MAKELIAKLSFTHFALVYPMGVLTRRSASSSPGKERTQRVKDCVPSGGPWERVKFTREVEVFAVRVEEHLRKMGSRYEKEQRHRRDVATEATTILASESSGFAAQPEAAMLARNESQ